MVSAAPLGWRAQLAALFGAVASPPLVGRRTGKWLLVFFVAAAAIVGLFGNALFSARDALVERVLAFVLSASELRPALERVSAWEINLYVRVAPGVELPVYLKTTAAP